MKTQRSIKLNSTTDDILQFMRDKPGRVSKMSTTSVVEDLIESHPKFIEAKKIYEKNSNKKR